MKIETRFNMTGKGIRLYLAILVFALIAISCGDSGGSSDSAPAGSPTPVD